MKSTIHQTVKKKYEFDGYLYIVGSFIPVESEEEGTKFIEKITDKLKETSRAAYLTKIYANHINDDEDYYDDDYDEECEIDYENMTEEEVEEYLQERLYSEYGYNSEDCIYDDTDDLGWFVVIIEFTNTTSLKFKAKYPKYYNSFAQITADFSVLCIEAIMHKIYDAYMINTVNNMVKVLLQRFSVEELLGIESNTVVYNPNLTVILKEKIAKSDLAYYMLERLVNSLYLKIAVIENDIIHAKNYYKNTVREIFDNNEKSKSKKKKCTVSVSPYSAIYFYKDGYFK